VAFFMRGANDKMARLRAWVTAIGMLVRSTGLSRRLELRMRCFRSFARIGNIQMGKTTTPPEGDYEQ
jgi:hypothetical protein